MTTEAEIVEVMEGDVVLARRIPEAVAWRDSFQFFSPDDDYLQVGSWCYPEGKELLAHAHNEVLREVAWTQEVLYVRQGKLRARIYNSKSELVASWEVVSGDILVLLRGGHGYDILETDTQVLEIKNGPYVGAQRDRVRLFQPDS